jgi:cytochrome c oxidase cbb3-type subunit 4
MTEVTPLGLVRALLTLTLSVAFVTLWIWAWRKERRDDFDAAARLPLQDDAPQDVRSKAR